jgi:hypothetical protein
VAIWVVTVLALVVALAALLHSRRMARQLAEVTQLYWQLKFDHGELKARVNPTPEAGSQPRQTFVPLSTLKKS